MPCQNLMTIPHFLRQQLKWMSCIWIEFHFWVCERPKGRIPKLWGILRIDDRTKNRQESMTHTFLGTLPTIFNSISHLWEVEYKLRLGPLKPRVLIIRVPVHSYSTLGADRWLMIKRLLYPCKCLAPRLQY